MPEHYLTDPRGGFVSSDPNVQARLIAMGAKGASPDTQIQTQAVSMLSPGVVVGGSYGQDPRGFQNQYQAITRSAPPSPSQTAGVLQPSPSQTAGVLQPGVANPTVGQVYSSAARTGNTELDAAYAAQLARTRLDQAPYDENKIREDAIRRFQSEIDATNQFYAEKKRERQAAESAIGEGRLGTNVAISARRGLIGSTFGEAQNQRIVDFNQQIQTDAARIIDAEKNQAVQSILGKARAESQQEIRDRKAAFDKSYGDAVSFLEGAADRAEKRADNVVTNLIASKRVLSDDDLDRIATESGFDLESLKAKLATAQKVATKTFTGIVAEYEYYKSSEIAAGRQPVSFSDYQTADANRKVITARQPTGIVAEYDYYKGLEKEAGRLPVSFNEYQTADANRKDITARQPTGIIAEYDYYKSSEIAAGRQPVSFSDYQTADANRRSSPSAPRYTSVSPGNSIYRDGVFVGTAPTAPTAPSGKAPTVVDFPDGTKRQWNSLDETWDVIAAKSDSETPVPNPPAPNPPAPKRVVGRVIDELQNLRGQTFPQLRRDKITQILTDHPDATNEQIASVLGFNNELQPSVKGSTDVSAIKDFQRVNTSIGSGVATGIVGGSSLWKPGFDLVIDGGRGAPVKTPFGGTVIFAGNDGGFGKSVKVRLDNGEVIRLSHLDSINAEIGQKFNPGSVIGTQGNTGSTLGKTGIHVDITMYRQNGKTYTSREVASFISTRRI